MRTFAAWVLLAPTRDRHVVLGVVMARIALPQFTMHAHQQLPGRTIFAHGDGAGAVYSRV
jgi:hypothetical protein